MDPLEGIDIELGSETQVARLDGRSFLLMPAANWTRTKAYELGDDNKLKPYAEASASLISWTRAR